MGSVPNPMRGYSTCLLEPEMTVEQLQKLVCDFGLEACAPYTSQTQLIRLIQLQCGDEPCFSSEKRYGCSEVCEWSGECRKLKAQWLY